MQNKWEKLFDEFMDLIEFTLIKYPPNEEHPVPYIWGVIDQQGANLGDIQSDRFATAETILDRMDSYINDYIAKSIENCLDEKGLLPKYEYDGWDDLLYSARDLLPDNQWDFDVLEMIIEHYDEINLNNCFYEEEE
jgi:hypothetical protein